MYILTMRIEPFLVTVVATASALFAQVARQSSAAAPSKNAGHAALMNMPLTFEPNRGQVDRRPKPSPRWRSRPAESGITIPTTTAVNGEPTSRSIGNGATEMSFSAMMSE